MASTNKLIRFGRNPKDYNCAANQYLREIVERRVLVYRDMDRTGRSFLLKAVLTHLYNQGFVFVRRDSRDGPWQSVSEREARLKIGHMFRDTMERMKKHGDHIIQYPAIGDDDEVMPLFEQEEEIVQSASQPPNPKKSAPLIDLTDDDDSIQPDPPCSSSFAGKSQIGFKSIVTPQPTMSIRDFDRSELAQHLLRVPILAEDAMEPIPWAPPSSASIQNHVSLEDDE